MPAPAAVAADNRQEKAFREPGEGGASNAPEELRPWIGRMQAARRDRAKYEHVWHLCQAFMQGHQWVGWDVENRSLREIQNPDDRIRRTINIITQHVTTQQGKLVLDDARPDVTFRRDDIESEKYANQARRAYEFGWEEEFNADATYQRASMKRLVNGIGAIWVTHDPWWGQFRDRQPVDAKGKPITDEAELQMLEEQGTLSDGSLPQFVPVREGRVVWRALGPLQILPPPGVEHEDDFPWIILERAVPITEVKGMYPQAAANLSAEKLRAVDTTGTGKPGGELKDHVRVYTGIARPTADMPNGETIVWTKQTVLKRDEQMPVTVNGVGEFGVAFLKYLQVDGRFWPVGLVQPLIGVQQSRNMMRSLSQEIIERGGFPWLLAPKGGITERNKLQGIPFQVVELAPGLTGQDIQPLQGIGPGSWIGAEVEMNDNDARQVTGTGDASLSQAPPSVSAFAHFAAMVEQDDRRIGPVRSADRLELVRASRYSLSLMKEWWWPDKELAIAGESGLMDTVIFNASQMPSSVYVRFSTSAPLPKSQAAEAQLIVDVFDRSIASGQTLPLDWLSDSLQGGKMQPLPKREMAVQQDKAEYENLLIANGRFDLVRPAPHDNDQLHVHFHRAAQAAYEVVPGYEQVAMMLEQHIQQHLMSAEMKAQQAPPTNNGQQQAPSQGTGGQNAGMGPAQASIAAGAM